MKLYIKNFIVVSVLFLSPLSAQSSTVIDSLTLRDFELSESVNRTHAGVCELLAHPQMISGKALLRDMVVNPAVDVNEVLERQIAIKTLVDDVEVLGFLEDALSSIALREKAIVAFDLAQRSAAVDAMIKSLFFSSSWLSRFNTSKSVLNARHALEYFTPVAVFAAEHAILRLASQHLEQKNHKREHKHDHGHVHGSSCAGGCIAGAKVKKKSPVWIKPAVKIAQFAHATHHFVGIAYSLFALAARMDVMNKLYQDLVSLNMLLADCCRVVDRLGENAALASVISRDNIDAVKMLIDSEYFREGGRLSLVSGVGATLVAYNAVQGNLGAIRRLLQRVAYLDVYVALARTMVDARGNEAKFCFVEFVSGSAPYLEMINGWHLMFNFDVLQTNSFFACPELGIKYVLSGPNGSGKSSLLRTLGVNVVLAQVFGIAAAEKFVLAPFHKIISFMTIADDVATGQSSFIARMIRSSMCCEVQDALAQDERCLALLDDSVGQGTSIERGEETAYQFIKKMGMDKKTVLVAATHYDRVKSLGSEPQSPFGNIRMSVLRNDQGVASPGYRVEVGVSDSRDVGVFAGSA